MKKIVLTGATGFIGRHCISPLLDRGYEIHAVSSKSQPTRRDGVVMHHVDLLCPEEVLKFLSEVRPTHLLHLAWFVEHGSFWTSPDNLRWVRASLHLMEIFAASGGERAVGVGTCGEYEWTHSDPCSEHETPLNPATLYGTCKHAVQSILHAFADQNELSAAWGRIFFAYGPYEDSRRLVPLVINALREGQPARCSHGNQVRDFMHVRDVADALVALTDCEVIGPVNIASGTPVSIKDVVMEIGGQMGHPEQIQLGALPEAENDPPVLVADVNRLKKEVGWSPSFDLENGLRQTIVWWKEHSLQGPFN